MHVLFIPSWYKTPDRPLHGVFFEEQARALMKRGIQVGVFFPEIEMRFISRIKGKKTIPEDFDDRSLPTLYHFTTSIVPRSRRLNYFFLCLTSDIKFKRYILKYGKPDILHAHSVFSGGIVAKYLSKKYKIPYVITEHYSGLVAKDMANIPYNIKVSKLVYENARMSMAVSRSFADSLVSKYSLRTDQMIVVPNLVNELFFAKLPTTPKREMLVLFANSFLNANKNIKLILDSFRLLLNRIGSATLYIGGDGDQMEYLKSYCNDLSLGGNVVFLGLLDRNQVKEYLDRCDIFLSTSFYETFGIALIEALACGKPVVSTNSGGPRDIIGPEDGLLIDSFDPVDFYQGVMHICQHYSQYNSDVIRKRCADRFSESEVTSKLIQIYQSSAK